MSTDLTPDPEASLPDSNASESESQPNESAEVPVESPASPPIFPELLPQNGAFLAHFDLFGSRNLAPFRLRTVLLACLIFGVGGIYFGTLNWLRLGKPKQGAATFILGMLGLIGSTFALLLFTPLGSYDGEWSSIVAELLSRLAIGGIIVLLQRPHRQRWVEANGTQTPSLSNVGGCWTLMIAYPMGLGYFGFMRYVLVPALLTFLSGTTFLTPQLTYSLGSFDVTYDSSWRIYAQEEEAPAGCMTRAGIECLLVAENRLTSAAWIVMQFEIPELDLAAFDEELARYSTTAWPGDYTLGNPITRQIGGHNARVRNNVIVQANNNVTLRMKSVLLEDEDRLIWMLFFVDERNLELAQDRFQRILDSIDFHDTE
ncbi:MAG: hypothetical protein IPK17_06750 [Chloroflexi bacterium]|uniref:hypothetical protein n=1 Tax=Candidatus Flexifilum breve TaxID=3140694 RepID=UPI0031373653|nr:hypothetical protein [Chloroflexota bacterium]